jgi:thioredoxin-like negative regulator of GroEL
MKVVKIEVNEQPELSNRFAVQATPTFILFRKGRQRARLDGAPKEKIDLITWLDRTSSLG